MTKPLSLLLCLAACTDLETGTTEQHLDGTWEPLAPFCDGRYDTKITQAMAIANANVRSSTFHQCLVDSLQSYTESFPEEIIDQLKLDTPLGTWVSCISLGGGDLAQAPIGIADERLYIDPDYLASTTADDLASTIVHEVLHNRGYQHPQDNGTATLPYYKAFEYQYTINEQGEACSKALSYNWSIVGNGPKRSALAQETRLAPTGWGNGPHDYFTHCPSGTLAMGLRGRAHTFVDAIGLSCRAPGGGAVTAFAVHGGGGGDAFALDCAPGEVMIGTYGHAASVNDRIGPICASASAVAAGTDTTGTVRGYVGGDGGHIVYRRCPARMAVRAITGKYDDYVNRMELDCQRVDNLEAVRERELAYVGDDHPNTTTFQTCPGRAALVGLTMHSGDRLDRLGGKCMPVTSQAGASPTLRTTTDADYPYMMSAWGGTGGYVGEADCGAGRAVVGLEIWHDGDGVAGMRAECASPASWFAGTASPVVTALHGKTTGIETTVRCATNELLVGWQISTGTLVDGVQPVCRAF